MICLNEKEHNISEVESKHTDDNQQRFKRAALRLALFCSFRPLLDRGCDAPGRFCPALFGEAAIEEERAVLDGRELCVLGGTARLKQIVLHFIRRFVRSF